MGHLFEIDGKLFHAMSKTADLVTLNLLWLICCLPVVTIGASTSALYCVTLKMAVNEDTYVCSSFFHSLKENMKQSLIIWGAFLVMGVVLYFDFYAVSHGGEGMFKLLVIPLILVTFLLVMTACYVFPILAFFKNSVKGAVKNSLYMALAHLPYTVLILIIYACPYLLLFTENLVFGMFVDLVVGFSLSAWMNSYLFRKLFDQYTQSVR